MRINQCKRSLFSLMQSSWLQWILWGGLNCISPCWENVQCLSIWERQFCALRLNVCLEDEHKKRLIKQFKVVNSKEREVLVDKNCHFACLKLFGFFLSFDLLKKGKHFNIIMFKKKESKMLLFTTILNEQRNPLKNLSFNSQVPKEWWMIKFNGDIE